MHYYQFHVSDYIHDTAHLSNDEDLAFRRLLDLYYTQEKPIPNKTQEVARRIRMPKSIEAIQIVLEEFFMFDMENDCWRHKRCDETIAAYQLKAERNREIGKLGGRPKANQVVTQTVSKDNPNQEPITNNQKPIKEKVAVAPRPDDVSENVWNDWVALRKKKGTTISQTAIDGAREEAAKIGWTLQQFLVEWCTRGSQGLKADWIKPAEKQTFAQQAADIARTTVPAKQGPDPALVKIKQDREKAAPMPAHIRDRINSVLRKV